MNELCRCSSGESRVKFSLLVMPHSTRKWSDNECRPHSCGNNFAQAFRVAFKLTCITCGSPNAFLARIEPRPSLFPKRIEALSMCAPVFTKMIGLACRVFSRWVFKQARAAFDFASLFDKLVSVRATIFRRDQSVVGCARRCFRCPGLISACHFLAPFAGQS